MSPKRKFSLACNKEGYLVLTWFIVRISVLLMNKLLGLVSWVICHKERYLEDSVWYEDVVQFSSSHDLSLLYTA